MMQMHYYGHSCFHLLHKQVGLLFDPFFTNNPLNTTDPKKISCNFILVSHAHGDHLGDTFDIAQRTKAVVISTAEVANLCAQQGCSSHAMHLGGKHKFDFGSVRITPAFHGSGIPGGHACGFIVDFFGVVVYFAGDTGLFGDMELLGRLEKIDYALLPIGDNYTMGPQDAEEAVGMLKPRIVVPMHYNTWPIIEQSPENFKTAVEKRFQIPVQIMPPGTKLTLTK